MNDDWSLWAGADRNSATSIVVSADLLWRLWTKGIAPTEARSQSEIRGDNAHADPLFVFVAIMA